MKALLGEVGLVLLEALALAAVLWLLWRKLTTSAAALPSFDKVASSAGDIVQSIPSLVDTALFSAPEGDYITADQQRQMAAAALARTLAAKGAQ